MNDGKMRGGCLSRTDLIPVLALAPTSWLKFGQVAYSLSLSFLPCDVRIPGLLGGFKRTAVKPLA